jgi:hypothetical protein
MPSGQRIARIVSKHSASMWAWMFTIAGDHYRRLDGPRPCSVPDTESVLAGGH